MTAARHILPTARLRRDVELMCSALRMAERGLGTTMPNPSVGAVLARDDTGEVLARGWTQPGGRPHAETTALARAAFTHAEAIRGATLYVTLEPCSHHGKTAPCADAVIAAGISRVVYGIADPDPRVAGRGLERMAAAGIAVAHVADAALVNEIRWATRGHIARVTERRPMVTLKLALGIDGAVSRGTGQPTWVTGPDARAHGHLLRARADAILVGAGTVVDDDPDLTCRLPGLGGRTPIAVVLSRSLRLPLAAKLVSHARDRPLRIYHGRDAAPERVATLAAAGAHLAIVQAVGDGLWLPAVLEDLASAGVTRLLVEGGPTAWAAFSRAGLVDEVEIFAGGQSGPRPSTANAISAASRHIDLEPLVCYASRDIGTTDTHVLLRRR